MSEWSARLLRGARSTVEMWDTDMSGVRAANGWWTVIRIALKWAIMETRDEARRTTLATNTQEGGR